MAVLKGEMILRWREYEYIRDYFHPARIEVTNHITGDLYGY